MANEDDIRVTYSVRLKKNLINRVKHLAIDEDKKLSELIEEGIELILHKYEEKKPRK